MDQELSSQIIQRWWTKIQALFKSGDMEQAELRMCPVRALDSYEYLGRCMNKGPPSRKISAKRIENYISWKSRRWWIWLCLVVSSGVPAFSLSSLNWAYFNYNFDTNLDTYDKIRFGDVRTSDSWQPINGYMAVKSLSKWIGEIGFLDRRLESYCCRHCSLPVRRMEW